jgi:outer membrane protein assembly factor BamB
MKTFFGLIAFAMSASAALAGDTWPGWRGPTGLGLSDERDLPLTWGGSTNENIIWKSPLPGLGPKAKSDLNQSSPIVWKDRVFIIAAYWPDGVAPTEYPEHHVACYSAADGKVLWDVKAPPGPWLLKDLRGGYAAPTPCTDGERVYALFGSSELVALDFDGKLLWRTPIYPYAWDVAIGTSPVLTRDAVLVLADGTKPAISRLIAFDKVTGNVKWERKRPEANFNHTTPVPIEVDGKQQLVIASSSALQGVDPVNGEVIWWATNKGDVPTPAYGGGLVYSEGGRGGPGIAVDPTGIGDVTATKVKWTTRPIPEGYSSPTIAGGFVYRAHSPGVLTCFALANGKQVFAERLPNGFNTSASPVLTADNRLYFANGGKSIVLPVGSKYEPIATNDLGDSGAASPAIAHGRMYIKGSKYLYCVGKPAPSP